MRAIAILAAAAALLALGGCDRLGIGGGGGGNVVNESANASANAAAGNAGGEEAGGDDAQAGASDGAKDLAGGATPAAADGFPLNRAYIVGRWTDHGDCSLASEFTMDGRFIANNGNEGLWNLAGDRLTLQGERTLTLQIVPIDQNTMTVVNADGSLGRSTRC
jgi:hypothetical protein